MAQTIKTFLKIVSLWKTLVMDFDIFVIFGETFAKRERVYLKVFDDLVSSFWRSSPIFGCWSKCL